MTDFNVIVGDIVELAPNRTAYTGDMDLEKGLILEVDHFWETMKVVFFADNQDNEKTFESDSVIATVPFNRIREVERHYKVLDVIDNIDTRTNQPVSVIKMGKVYKKPIETVSGFRYTENVQELDTDTFIYVGVSSFDIEEYVDTIVQINFSEYRISEADINGEKQRAYHSTRRVLEPAELFMN